MVRSLIMIDCGVIHDRNDILIMSNMLSRQFLLYEVEI